MTELSAHLVDAVLPAVAVRQWVLTFPHPLRYALAWNHERARGVLGVFNGVLAPNAKWREEVVWYGHGGWSRRPGQNDADVDRSGRVVGDGQADREPLRGARRSYTWAELLRRAFLVDVLFCPRCRGRMRVVATLEDPAVVKKILEHLGLPAEIPSPKAARPPPEEPEYFPDHDEF